MRVRDKTDEQDKERFKHELGVRVVEFHGNHNQESHGNWAGAGAETWDQALSRAQETIPNINAERPYWLTKDGMFVSVKGHVSVIPEEMWEGENDAYEEFSKKNRVIRVTANPKSSSVEMWQQVNDDQMAAITSELKRSTVYVTAHHRDDEFVGYAQRKANPSREEIDKMLVRANNYIRSGVEPPESAEFLSLKTGVKTP